ncbi:hypothetical protein VTN49DRAFT_7543 [Thermomyces lanuginosus]|uniref:uncharacterized protein n=1 Tax=Thermomyces lanuginosus TaxID=5541 RepID=UPI0037444C2F
MKFLGSVLSALSLAAFAAAAPAPQGSTADTSVEVRYDTVYDDAGLSTLSLACSDGENGLFTKGYATIGALPNFPLVGGAPTIEGWNSPNCGACYRLTYKDTSINVIGVDVARGGFVLSKAAMDQLTNGLAEQLGHVTATFEPAAPADCGFTE